MPTAVSYLSAPYTHETFRAHAARVPVWMFLRPVAQVCAGMRRRAGRSEREGRRRKDREMKGRTEK